MLHVAPTPSKEYQMHCTRDAILERSAGKGKRSAACSAHRAPQRKDKAEEQEQKGDKGVRYPCDATRREGLARPCSAAHHTAKSLHRRALELYIFLHKQEL